METQTHLKLYIREAIDNWKYIDSIIFLVILLIYSGFTDPCESCQVSHPSIEGEMISCKERFISQFDLTFNEEEFDLGSSNINLPS